MAEPQVFREWQGAFGQQGTAQPGTVRQWLLAPAGASSLSAIKLTFNRVDLERQFEVKEEEDDDDDE